jgi:methylthioribulose-1-phosphate dehydratase
VPASFASCAQTIAEAARALFERGWVPATSGNFSMRVEADRFAITLSGRDKSRLRADDVTLVDLEGVPVNEGVRPSAETLLHAQLYRRFSAVAAVLHTHSLQQTLASRVFAAQGLIRFENWELLKAFEGITSHQAVVELPIFANSQDMEALAATVDEGAARGTLSFGYLIEGHGLYTWGSSMSVALRHLEAFEFLLGCELELRKYRT